MTPQIRHLSAAEVATLMPSWPEIIDIVESALKELGNGTGQMPPKVDLAPGGSTFLHAMPAQVAGMAGMKWVGGSPDNAAKGLPYVQGNIILNDPETGTPLAIMDATEITAKRTAGCTAVAARHLADPGSEVMTILGCGVQGRANIAALLAVFPDTERMLCFDIDTEKQARFADEVALKHEIAAIVPPDPKECCVGGHIIVTSGPISRDPKPVIEPDWIQTGTLCVPLDFDGYFMPESFAAADLLLTDDLAQFAHYRGQGFFKDCPDPTTDLPAIVAGKHPGRPDGDPIVITANLGLGILDVALGAHILRAAEAKGTGTMLDS